LILIRTFDADLSEIDDQPKTLKQMAIKILHLEDNQYDSLIIKSILKEAWSDCEYNFADNEADFIECLKSKPIDIILSDYKLPDYGGMEALGLIKAEYPEIPFLFVSGTMGEDAAINSILNGAIDYVLKNKMERLVPAIKRALREAELTREYKAAIESLRLREEQYRTLVEGIHEGLLMTDARFSIRFANRRFYEMFGYNPSEITGKTAAEFFHNDDYPGSSLLQRIVDIGLKHEYIEIQLFNKRGDQLWFRVSSSPINNAEGNYTGLIIVFDSIQDLKIKDQTILLQGTALNNAANAVLITDAKGTIQWINRAFTLLTGYERDEAIGKNPRELVKSDKHDRAFYKNFWDQILSGNSWRGEMINRKKDNTLYYEEQVITPIKNEPGKITHFVAIKSNITERKQFEKDLLFAKEKAESGDRLKSSFINNISHEVRTPLNGILGFSQLITRRDISESEKEEYYTIINNSSKRLTETITNYMDIAMISSGTMEVKLKSFDLLKLLSEIREHFDPMCKVKGLDLTLKIPEKTDHLILVSDRNILNKILSQLLHNAVKFTFKGEITFGFTSQTDTLNFFVNDTGTGINQEVLERIFENFVQEEASNTRGYEGSGLGLSIAKGLLQLLNSEISVQSQKGKGASFSFSIPFSELKSDAKMQTINKDSVSKIAKHMVLVAEDDDSNRFYLEVILKKSAIGVLIATNGKEAVDQCKLYPEISLVLMDLKMPVMDGFEATREIKAFRSDLPVIAVSAYCMNEEKNDAMEAGCDDYVSKPVDSMFLMNTLKKYGLTAL
jgi:hypothetical protein